MIEFGNVDVVKLIEDSDLHSFMEIYGQSPLHIACESGQLEVAKYLLKKGFKLYDEDEVRTTRRTLQLQFFDIMCIERENLCRSCSWRMLEAIQEKQTNEDCCCRKRKHWKDKHH